MSETNGYAKTEDIFAAFSEVKYRDVSVMGMKVRIRTLSTAEILEWSDENQQEKETANERLVAMACDKPKFTPEDVRRLHEMKNGAFVMRLAKECAEHAGIQDVEETEKN